MSQIYDPPNDYDFGLSFNYDVWTPGSMVKLTSVPWDSMYRDTVLFNSRALLDAYIDNRANAIPVDSLFHIKPSRPAVRLGIPYNTALKYNYIKVTNGAQPITGDSARSFYYFIREVNYIAPGTTELVLQLDVWQTYIYDLDVKSGYLERGHAALSTDVTRLKTPEPFDMGDTYVTAGDMLNEQLISAFEQIGSGFAENFYIAITSVIDLTAPPGTESAPKITSARGSIVQGVLSPASVYCVDIGDYFNLFLVLTEYPWITQGIVDMRLYPKAIGIGDRIQRRPNPDSGAHWPPGDSTSGTTDGYLREPPYTPRGTVPITGIPNISASIRAAMKTVTPSEWHWAIDRFNKFLTAPYSYIEFHSQQGESVNLNPEGFTGNEIELTATGSIAPGDVRLAIHADNYVLDRSLDNCYTVTNLPQLPILNNNAAISLASQARSLQQSRASTSWAQQKALAATANSDRNTAIGLQADRQTGDISRNLDAQGVGISNQLAQNTAGLRAVTGIIGGAIGGLPAGPAGVAAGVGMAAGNAIAEGIGTGMNIDAANQQLAARTAASQSTQDVSQASTQRISDNNSQLARSAARGDYADTIASIDAKVQDAQMIPPSMSGSFGASNSLLAMHGEISLRARVKHVPADAIIRHAQQWSRYGYFANRFMNVGNLKRNSVFTYWKLLETYIDVEGVSANESVLLTVRGIFEKGVTIWNNPDQLGNYDFEGNTAL